MSEKKTFNTDIEIVKRRYNDYRGLDPFPNIIPALLNSADVATYIKTLGMVSPFYEDQLSGVTLSLKVGDTAVYWNQKKEKEVFKITNDDSFVLKSNTIAYITIEEELRLPAYIIARFNLRVTNAYRGILLGTGPIVDPGFVGRLNIPLHNLTNNDYVFSKGESFIEMEFTKISNHPNWNANNKPITNSDLIIDLEYRKWDSKSDKKDLSLRNIHYYLNKANQGSSIESSLPNLRHKTDEAIEKTNKNIEKVDTSLNRINIGLLFSFGALLGAIIAIVNIFRGDIKEIKDKKLEDRIRVLEEVHKQDTTRIRILETRLDTL
jgi:deoxycytidine triphosphate deaminase